MPSNIKYKAETDFNKLLGELNKAIAKNEELAQKVGKVSRAGKQAGNAFDGIIGKAAGLVSVAAVLGKINEALAQQAQAARDASQQMGNMESHLKGFLQISEDDKQFRQLVALRNEMAVSAGLPLQEAGDTVFTLKSAKFTDEEVRLLAEVKKFEKDASAVLTSVADIRAAFPEFGGGDLRAMINALGPAASASKLKIGELAGQVLSTAKLGKPIGTTVPEAMAAAALATFGSENPAEAKTQLNAFIKKLSEDKQFKGSEGLFAAMRKYGQLPPARQEQIIGGRAEARLGAELALRIDELVAYAADIEKEIGLTGTTESYLRRKQVQAANVPRLVAIDAAASAASKREVAEVQSGFAYRQKQRDIIKDYVLGDIATNEGGWLERFQANNRFWIANLFDTDPYKMASREAKYAPRRDGMTDVEYAAVKQGVREELAATLGVGSLEELREGMRDLKEASENLNKAAEKMNNGGVHHSAPNGARVNPAALE